MKSRYLHTAATFALALLQTGLLALVPAAELCSAAELSGGCFCDMECCAPQSPASLQFPVLSESPCCTLGDSNGTQEAAVPADKTTLPAPPRIMFETVPAGAMLSAVSAEATVNLSVTRVPCVAAASIPLLNSSLLI